MIADTEAYWRHWTDWNNDNRTIPEPTFEAIGEFAGVVRIDFGGEESSLRLEARSMPNNGFGSYRCVDYYALSMRKALQYLQENGLRLDVDHSTVCGIEMLVYRPFDPTAEPTHRRHRKIEAPHVFQNYHSPCFLCGCDYNVQSHNNNCSAILAAMGFHVPVGEVLAGAHRRSKSCLKIPNGVSNRN